MIYRIILQDRTILGVFTQLIEARRKNAVILSHYPQSIVEKYIGAGVWTVCERIPPEPKTVILARSHRTMIYVGGEQVSTDIWEEPSWRHCY